MSGHQFAAARHTALKAVAVRRTDSTAYGVLGDAAYELGLYEECAKAYQKMMDLRPSTASYSRAAFYRRLVGDLDGATRLMKQALQLADANDIETQSWCLLQMGNFSLAGGKLEEAENRYGYSLKLLPNYYNALAGMAKVKAAKNDHAAAIDYYKKAISVVPMPEYVAALGDLYRQSGRPQKASEQYELVEYIGVISKINRQIYNRQLALFYADHDRKLPEALKLTSEELRVRKDIFGYDAYAWCLYKNGRIAEAKSAMRKALKMGTIDPLLAGHARAILKRF